MRSRYRSRLNMPDTHRGIRRTVRRFRPGVHRTRLAAGLDAVHGPELVPAIYQRMKERLAAEPARYVFRYQQVMVLLAKK